MGVYDSIKCISTCFYSFYTFSLSVLLNTVLNFKQEAQGPHSSPKQQKLIKSALKNQIKKVLTIKYSRSCKESFKICQLLSTYFTANTEPL